MGLQTTPYQSRMGVRTMKRSNILREDQKIMFGIYISILKYFKRSKLLEYQ